MNAPALPAPAPEERRWLAALLVFTGFSLLAHAATFLLFQAVYPPRVTIPPVASPITVLTADNPEQQAVLRWIESEDPALAAASAHPAPPPFFEVPYRPSYLTPRTLPRSLPPKSDPPVHPPGPGLEVLLRSLAPAGAAHSTPIPRAPTQLIMSGGLRERPLLTKPVCKTAAPGPLESATFLLGVAPDGAVRYTLLQKTSGDAATDALALSMLARQRFAPREDGSAEAWGWVTITWGDDAYPPPERPK